MAASASASPSQVSHPSLPQNSNGSTRISGSRSAWQLAKRAVTDFFEDGALSQAAAISFYMLLSMAPLLVIVISIAGFVWEPHKVRGQLVGELGGIVGPEGATMLEEIIAKASENRGSGIVATVIGVITLLLGALGVFGQLKTALNTIWEVELKSGRGWKGMVMDRLLSFAMVLCIAFLLLVSMMAGAVISAAGGMIEQVVALPPVAMQAINLTVSFGLITLLFAAMFKILPDVTMPWRIVWIGAASTALLFTIGKHLIGLYLGHSSTASVYGAAGSLALILTWVYYSAAIFLLGAEFTQAYARSRQAAIQPAPSARWTASASAATDGHADGNERTEGNRAHRATPRTNVADQTASARPRPRRKHVKTEMAKLFLMATMQEWTRQADRRRPHA